MNAKLSSIITKIKCFCATQSFNFYVGMVFSALCLLTLTAYMPLSLGVALCPFGTILLYTLGRLVKEPFKILKTINFKQDIFALLLGNFWVLLFVFI